MEPLPEPYEIVRTFDRQSPAFDDDLEAFRADMEFWQRAARIDGFIETLSTEGDKITIRLMPFSSTPNAKIPPPPAAFRGSAQAVKRDGFEKNKAAQVALTVEAGTADRSPKVSESLQAELQALLRGRHGGV